MADETAARAFVPERYRAYLHLLARVRLRKGAAGPVDASDVVQEALLKAHRNREQFRGDTEGQWRAWLRRILANVLADACRDARREQAICGALDQSASGLEDFLASVLSTPSQNVEHEEQLLLLAEALANLSDDERTALELRFLQQPPWSLADIAATLNRPTAKAVAGLLSRGLAKLRTFLRETT
jgi:RNA polymerase sigma-70 factor (ECF subfamily)